MNSRQEWIDGYFIDIIKQIEFYLVYHLAIARLKEHFLLNEIENVVIPFDDPNTFLENQGWMEKMKNLLLTYMYSTLIQNIYCCSL